MDKIRRMYERNGFAVNYGWADSRRSLDYPVGGCMNDRQLLELAAKAAGISILGPADKYIAQHEKGESAFIIDNDRGGNSNWNPLTDDGDALRLAVKLRLTIQFPWDDEQKFIGDVCVWNRNPNPTEESIRPDEYAATRRAIVRAAAEIGKEMA